MEKFYFIHIRKVAGTSVRAFLEENFTKREICPELSQVALFGKIPKEQIADYVRPYRLISGHYYNLPKFFDEKRFTFTILREPLSRTISEINQIRNDPNDIWHKRAQGLGPCEMLSEPAFDLALDNSQTRFLVNNSNRRYEALSDRERLERAKRYLDEIDFFGTTENLTLSLFMLSKAAGLQPPRKLFRANTKITQKGLTIEDFMPCMAKLYERNRLDLPLYAYAKRKFEERTLAFLQACEAKG